MVDTYRNNMVARLIKIRDKIEKGYPLLLIEVSILLTILNIEDFPGTNIVNVLRNSTILEGEHAFRNSRYYERVKTLLDRLIESGDRVIETDSVNDTVIFAAPITVTVPNSSGTGLVEVQIVPYLGTMITKDKGILNNKKRIMNEFNVSEDKVNPLEALLTAEEVSEDEKVELIKSTMLIQSREIAHQCIDEDEFYGLFEGSDGFIINYDKDKYIVIAEVNSNENEEGKDSLMLSVLNDRIRVADPGVIEMIFY